MYFSQSSFAFANHPISLPITVLAVYSPAARIRAETDLRWPMILRKMALLRRRGRRSIRIVDANCRGGELLLLAALRARALGFVAIEARGTDSDPQMISRARHAPTMVTHPAIGVDFEIGEPFDAFREEAAFPADIVLHAGQTAELSALADRAGVTVLAQRSSKDRVTA